MSESSSATLASSRASASRPAGAGTVAATLAITAKSCATRRGESATRTASASKVVSSPARSGTGARACNAVARAPKAGMTGATSSKVSTVQTREGSHRPEATDAETSETRILNALNSFAVSGAAPSSRAPQLSSWNRPRSRITVAASASASSSPAAYWNEGAATRGACTITDTFTSGRSASDAARRSRATAAVRLALSVTARRSISSCSASCAGLCRESVSTSRSMGARSATTCAGASVRPRSTSGAPSPSGAFRNFRRSALLATPTVLSVSSAPSS